MIREDSLEEAGTIYIHSLIYSLVYSCVQAEQVLFLERQEMKGPVLSQDLEGETAGDQIITMQWKDGGGGMNQERWKGILWDEAWNRSSRTHGR